MLAGAVANCVLNYFSSSGGGRWAPAWLPLSAGLVFALRAADTHRICGGCRLHPEAGVAVNFVLLAAEALVLLAEVPLRAVDRPDHGGGDPV